MCREKKRKKWLKAISLYDINIIEIRLVIERAIPVRVLYVDRFLF